MITPYQKKRYELQQRLMALQKAPLSRAVVQSLIRDADELAEMYYLSLPERATGKDMAT